MSLVLRSNLPTNAAVVKKPLQPEVSHIKISPGTVTVSLALDVRDNLQASVSLHEKITHTAWIASATCMPRNVWAAPKQLLAWQVLSTSPLKSVSGTASVSRVCSALCLWWAVDF